MYYGKEMKFVVCKSMIQRSKILVHVITLVDNKRVFFISLSRQHNGTSAEEDNYNADVDGEGDSRKDNITYTADALKSDQNQFSPKNSNR